MALDTESSAAQAADRRRPGYERLTVIIPVLNEERNVGPLAERLAGVLETTGMDWRALFVDDGSRDGTLAAIREIHAREPRVEAISLSRRFGKEIAVAAGLRHVGTGGAVLMDGDFQHPPELIPELIARWREGYDVVYGRRRDRDTDTAMHRLSARWFYRLFRFMSGTELPEGAGDFRLLGRKAIDAMNRLGERARFNKGLYAWIGFRSIGVPFDVEARRDGVSRWRPRALLRFALDGLTTFSTVPLRLATYLGLLVSGLAFLYVVGFLVKTLLYGIDVAGFPTIVVSVMALSGVQLITLGVIGEYLGRVYEEVKARPLFLVRETVGDVGDPADAGRESTAEGR